MAGAVVFLWIFPYPRSSLSWGSVYPHSTCPAPVCFAVTIELLWGEHLDFGLGPLGDTNVVYSQPVGFTTTHFCADYCCSRMIQRPRKPGYYFGNLPQGQCSPPKSLFLSCGSVWGKIWGRGCFWTPLRSPWYVWVSQKPSLLCNVLHPRITDDCRRRNTLWQSPVLQCQWV